jgi:hypothetical protein
MRSLSLFLLLSLVACDPPEVTFVRPVETVDGGSNAPVVQVVVEDPSVAAALGWEGGVPRAAVLLQRFADVFNPTFFETDSLGRAPLPRNESGLYWLAARRIVGEDEAAVAGWTVDAFGDGQLVTLPASVTLALGRQRGTSLVISEIYKYEPPFTGYQGHGFIELYNNGDSTVYLDGMLLGLGYSSRNHAARTGCDASESFRTDPDGIWSIFIHRFPGTGTSHPMAPGQAVVIAQDALDHSVVDPVLLDLSAADFELEGTTDADNPSVPNLADVGLRSEVDGHGMSLGLGMILYLAHPTDLSAAPVRADAHGVQWLRIPAHNVVDVTVTRWSNPDTDSFTPPCGWDVNPTFDRLPGGFLAPNRAPTASVERVAYRVSSAGRVQLQDLNTSFVDLVQGLRSPGSVPTPP